MQDTWHQRIRERALGLWEAEGKPPGRELAHWLRAEEDLWKESLGVATALADYVNRIGRNLDAGTDEGLLIAAETGCRAMRFLIEETDFKAQLAASAGRPPLTIWSAEARAYLSDFDLFEDFIAVERRLLVRCGLDPVLADQIAAFLRREINRLRETGAGSAAALLDVAVYRACEAWDAVRERRTPPPGIPSEGMSWYRRSARGVWTAVGGGLVVVANVAAAAALTPVLAEVSKLVGTFMFEHGATRVLSASS